MRAPNFDVKGFDIRKPPILVYEHRGNTWQLGSAFNFWHPGLITLHLWLWYPNPSGLYMGTNPLAAPLDRG